MPQTAILKSSPRAEKSVMAVARVFELQSRRVAPDLMGAFRMGSATESGHPPDHGQPGANGAVALPDLIYVPARDGSSWIGRRAPDGHAPIVSRCTEGGDIVAEFSLAHEAPARPDVSAHASPWRLAGLAPLRTGFVAALAPEVSPERTDLPERGGMVLKVFADDGTLLHTIDDIFAGAGFAAGRESTGWHGAAMHGSSSRIAARGHRVCVHVGHLLRWPDGSLVQGGFARSLDLGSGLMRAAVLRQGCDDVLPWLGSRSLDQRCVADPFRDSFVLGALCDGFPRGILLARLGAGPPARQLVHALPGEPGEVSLAGELGGVVPLRQSVAVSFTSSVAAEPESRDVLVAFATPELHGTPLLVRVTHNAPGVYATQPKLARLGRMLLVAWKRVRPESGQVEPMLALVSPQAQLVLPPSTLQGLDFHQADDFVTDAAGCVNWLVRKAGHIHWMRLNLTRRTS